MDSVSVLHAFPQPPGAEGEEEEEERAGAGSPPLDLEVRVSSGFVLRVSSGSWVTPGAHGQQDVVSRHGLSWRPL